MLASLIASVVFAIGLSAPYLTRMRLRMTEFPDSVREPSKSDQSFDEFSRLLHSAVLAHYVVPNNSLSFDSVSGDLVIDERRNVSDTAQGLVPGIGLFGRSKVNRNVKNAFQFGRNSKTASRGYKIIDELATSELINSRRYVQVAGKPRLCTSLTEDRPESCDSKTVPFLLQFSNAIVDQVGRIYLVQNDSDVNMRNRRILFDVYDVAGGCCNEIGNKVPSETELRRIFLSKKTIARYGFLLAQHHGVTYHHAMFEILPRFFSFWNFVSSAPLSLNIIVSGNEIVPRILRTIGVPSGRIHALSSNTPYRYYSKLWVPAPFLQDGAGYPSFASQVHVPKILRDVVLAKAPVSKSSILNMKELPLLVLIERAHSRRSKTMWRKASCTGRRCMQNFESLRELLAREFDGLLQVVTFPATAPNMFETGINLFARAFVVVGIHGAGFQNIVFMKPSTYAIHYCADGMWKLYAKIASKHNVKFFNILTPDAKQNAVNVHVDEDVTLLEIWRILEEETVPGVASARKERDDIRGRRLRPAQSTETVMALDPVTGKSVFIYEEREQLRPLP